MTDHWECVSWAALACVAAFRLGVWVAWRRAESRVFQYVWDQVNDEWQRERPNA